MQYGNQRATVAGRKVTLFQIILSVFSGVLMLGGSSWAKEYHVSSGGSDEAGGTAQAPWKTIQRAAEVMKGGIAVLCIAVFIGNQYGRGSPARQKNRFLS